MQSVVENPLFLQWSGCVLSLAVFLLCTAAVSRCVCLYIWGRIHLQLVVFMEGHSRAYVYSSTELDYISRFHTIALNSTKTLLSFPLSKFGEWSSVPWCQILKWMFSLLLFVCTSFGTIYLFTSVSRSLVFDCFGKMNLLRYVYYSISIEGQFTFEAKATFRPRNGWIPSFHWSRRLKLAPTTLDEEPRPTCNFNFIFTKSFKLEDLVCKIASSQPKWCQYFEDPRKRN